MNSVPRSVVVAAIDATATLGGGVVAIRYVKADGEISVMRVRKSAKNRAAGSDKRPGATSNYHVRNRGLIRIIDMDDQQPKSLFIFTIIGFNPSGDVNQLAPVHHG